MPEPSDTEPAAQPELATRHPGLAALNAAAIVVAALYLGRELLVPAVLAVLLAFVLAPLAAMLQRIHIGKAPAVLVTVAFAFALISGIGLVVGQQATTLAKSLPAYRDTIQEKMTSLTTGTALVERLNSSVHSLLNGASEGAAAVKPKPPVAAPPAPAAPTATGIGELGSDPTIGLLRSVVQPLFSPLATVGVVVVFVIFVLLYREDLRDRLVRLVGRRDLHRTILAMNDAAARLSRYFLIQLALNTGFGLFITGGLWLAGLPNPVLWGIVAALMRFVPYIGTVLALVLPLLLALAVSPGWSLALIVVALFIGSDLVMGQVIEPLLYGHSTGLSPLAVIVSATFWAFLWGPVGLLLATPVTVCLVVIGRHVEPLAFLEVILGDSPPLRPEETFYQRALEANSRELIGQARKSVADSSLADYYDQVAMRGLALAQADLARDTLEFDQLEAVHSQIATVIDNLGDARPPPIEPISDTSRMHSWHRDGAVVCIPGRGQLDDLAATMAMQVLRDAGFGARQESNAILGTVHAEPPIQPLLCCLSVLDQGSNPSGIRYLLRRIHRQMPDAVVVVGLWHATASSTLLDQLRAEAAEETIVFSIGELIALVRAISARHTRPEAVRAEAMQPT